MKLKVTINGTGAAFDTWPEIETARLLRLIAEDIEERSGMGSTGGYCMDINDNKVGEWSYKV